MTADASALTEQRSAAMYRHFLLHRGALESMAGGVMTVDADGRIGIFNNAASRLLGLVPAEAQWKLFAEVFLIREGLEEFTDTLLAAIHDEAVGARSTVRVRLEDGTERPLSVTTSYLVRRKDGESLKAGVVAVFDDITEIETLREAERRLMESTQMQNAELRDAYREIKAQHAELQQAYRKVEESGAALKSTMKKFQIVRVAATCLVIALFVAAGIYSWEFGPIGSSSALGDASSSAEARNGEALRTVVVRPRPLTSSISLVGRLAPWHKINVTSPISARVSAVHFQYGQAVRKGERLVELHTAEIKRKHRDAHKDYINALKDFRELQDWDNSPEVSSARRAFTKAQVALKNQKHQLEMTVLLAEQGIIPGKQHETARQQYFNQQLDFASAKQNLDIVLAKNSEEDRRVVQLALDNARERMRSLEQGLKGGDIRAPISGVVLDTREVGTLSGNGGGKGLAKGQSVQEGQVLLTIGDLRQMSVVTSVDEVHIPKIRTGQRFRATGDGFPDLALEGTVSHVSSEAHSPDRNVLPAFEVIGLLDEFDAAQRDRLRLGMSVDIDLLAYHNPAALMVPLEAVVLRQGTRWLKVRDKDSRRIREVEVETGATTVNAVEILRGISANDEIVLPGI